MEGAHTHAHTKKINRDATNLLCKKKKKKKANILYTADCALRAAQG